MGSYSHGRSGPGVQSLLADVPRAVVWFLLVLTWYLAHFFSPYFSQIPSKLHQTSTQPPHFFASMSFGHASSNPVGVPLPGGF